MTCQQRQHLAGRTHRRHISRPIHKTVESMERGTEPFFAVEDWDIASASASSVAAKMRLVSPCLLRHPGVRAVTYVHALTSSSIED